MKDIFGKINKAIDVITDAMVSRIPAVNETKEYKYSDLSSYIKKMRSEHHEIKKFTIAIHKASEYAGKGYAGERFVIRLVMLNEDNTPIIADKKSDDYLGTVIIAEAFSPYHPHRCSRSYLEQARLPLHHIQR